MEINVIESLIMKYCPNGVMYQTLNELGSFYSGLSGKCKKDFVNGNCKFITYINIYNNPAVNILVNDMVHIEDDEKQNSIEYGDVLFTGSSETPDECGFSSVVVDKIKEKIYLNSFCFGFRLTNKKLYSPNFLKYLFRSEEVRKKIKKTASGVTRFNVSKTKFGKISIPVPPLPVQEEIVRILDTYSELEAELETKLGAELDARKKQYEYYLNQLLSFDENDKDVKFMQLGEIGTFIKGNGLQKKDFTDSGVGCIHYGQIYTYYGTYTQQTKSFVSDELAKKLKKAQKGDLIIATTSENVEDVGKAVAWLGNESICIGGHSTVFHHNQNPKYMAYLFQTEIFFKQKQKVAKGVKVIDISDKAMSKFKFGFPPIEEQERIVSILDEFNKLTNEISDSLQAEITARKKQYEFYRNKLLTFKEAV